MANNNQCFHYSLRRRRCLAMTERAARATFPIHLKTSAIHGGANSSSSVNLYNEDLRFNNKSEKKELKSKIK